MKQLLTREGRSHSPVRLLEDTLQGIRDSIEVVERDVEVWETDSESEPEPEGGMSKVGEGARRREIIDVADIEKR